MTRRWRISLLSAALVALTTYVVMANPGRWGHEWPNTDFSKATVEFDEIFSGGPPKDGIPAVDDPKFVPIAEVSGLSETEPVIGVVIDGQAKAYPLTILMWHEIVNDELAGVPISVTFCPLCNAAIVFDRRLDDKVLDFGTTGKLRNSDLVMYDRQTESWWQQFLGQAIVGELTGAELTIVPARLESFANFKARAPKGLVQVPSNPNMRDYGRNPYAGYDSLAEPFLYRGDMPQGIAPLARVISIADRGRTPEAWSLALLQTRKRGELEDGIVISWSSGQNSALDSALISEGVDVGNVTVQRQTKDGLVDVAYGLDFAFAYHAFHPEAKIHTE